MSKPYPQDPERAGGLTVWLTGLPSAGKTTLARLVSHGLAAQGVPTRMFDGDELRRTVCADLGFSREDRAEQVRRAGELALAAAGAAAVSVVALVSPFADARALVRERHRAAGVPFAEVYVSADTAVCAARDVKGLYAAQRAGRLRGLTGVDEPYEAPVDPEIVVRTDLASPLDCAAAILSVVGSVSGRSYGGLMYRQGDILIVPVAEAAVGAASAQAPLPRDHRGRMVLALGEATGHVHAVAGRGALYPASSPLEPMTLHVPEGGRVVHDEHGAIALPAGWYRVVRQREYEPNAIRVVAD